MKQIDILLTEEHIEAIKPLWKPIIEADLKGKQGAILIQPRESGVASCIFVPHEQAEKIYEILKEIK